MCPPAVGFGGTVQYIKRWIDYDLITKTTCIYEGKVIIGYKVNGATLENAFDLKPLDDLGLLLIEQPLADDDLWDHHKMQKEF